MVILSPNNITEWVVIFISFIFFTEISVSIVTAREVEPCASKHHQWDSILSTSTVLKQEAACLMWSPIPAVERAEGHQSAAPQAPALMLHALTQLHSKTSHFSQQLEYSDCNPAISMHVSFKQTSRWTVRNTYQQCLAYY